MSNINQYPLEATQINDEDFYDVDYWNGSSFETRKISGATLKAELLNGYKNLSSTQWERTLPAPESLANGAIANGFTFFDNTDKISNGTTSYNEYDIAYGITVTLSGTSGTANINIDGTDYLTTFNIDLYTTAQDFITSHEVALNANNVRVFALGSGADGRLRFCSTQTILDAITITNVSGDLSGTIANEFTGTATSSPDHVLIPYTGTPIDGQRLHHTFRTNFNFDTSGQEGWAELSLRRYADDSIIGSGIAVSKNADVGGVQTTFITYTANATDPFATGGFYFALRNTVGQAVNFVDNIGILIQTEFEKPTKF